MIIDGNNLLHAMFQHAVIRSITRVSMVREIQQWTRRSKQEVTIVFDGPRPSGGFDKPNTTGRIDIRFAAPHSADDVIVRMIHAAPHPDQLAVVSSDTAIAYEARRRRCQSMKCEEFIRDAFPESPPRRPQRDQSQSSHPDAKIDPESAGEDSEFWLREFGYESGNEEPLDDFDAMMGDLDDV
ncbi:MAG: NYN domain-containing protein [Phycisphaerae bacterium]